MSDTLEKIDRFESVFKRSDKLVFEYFPRFYENKLIVCDKTEEKALEFTDLIKHYLDFLDDNNLGSKQPAWHTLARQDIQGVSTLLKQIDDICPSLIITYRNLCDSVENAIHSLGVMLDELTQNSQPPVLVLPADGMVPDNRPQTIMVATDHLTGDHRLVNQAIPFARPDGCLYLCHIEDDAIFNRYMSAIECIPEINTESANEKIKTQLLKVPHDYIQSCIKSIKDAEIHLTVKSEIMLGHKVSDYRKLVEKHNIDLLVINTKDKSQIAMHGMAYSIAVEFRDTPLLML